MRLKRKAALLVAATLVALVGPAIAVPTLVEADGSSADVDYPFTAVSKGGLSFSSGSAAMGCTSGAASGTVRGGTRGNPIAEIRSVSSTGCVGPFGMSLTVEMMPISSPGPWHATATAVRRTPSLTLSREVSTVLPVG